MTPRDLDITVETVLAVQAECMQALQAALPAIERVQDMLRARERFISESARWNAGIDKIAPDEQCPRCEGPLAVEVLDPLPETPGMEVIDRKSLVCRNCDLELYPPPLSHFRHKADDFLAAAKQLQPGGPPVVIAYLLHHAA